MTPFDKLSAAQRSILSIIDERTGASARYLARHTTYEESSVRRSVGELRKAGYDIAFGVERGCANQKLYSWVKSPVAAQPVVGRIDDAYAEELGQELENELKG